MIMVWFLDGGYTVIFFFVNDGGRVSEVTCVEKVSKLMNFRAATAVVSSAKRSGRLFWHFRSKAEGKRDVRV